jgi:predicted CXXCH cytochrome family protein
MRSPATSLKQRFSKQFTLPLICGARETSWRRLVFRFLVLAVAGIGTMGLGQKRPESVQGPSVASRTPDYDAPASEFVGPDRCKDCHKEVATEYWKTAHAKLSFPKKDYIQGCETCHGPGKAHADAIQAAHGDDAATAKALKEHPIFAFRGAAEENAGRCLGCHITSKQQDFFAHAEHAGHALSCNQCHSAHLVEEIKDQSKGDLTYPQGYFFQAPRLADETRWLHNSLLKQSEPGLCYTCHQTIQAQFALPNHHRVPEGLIKCTDCHNPHGTMNLASLNAPRTETCVKCHVEKRGPYVYEHPVVRVQGCISCHNPHGSPNRMLLVRREGRQLCLECHNGFHTQASVPHSRLGFQASGECVRCHVTIHGSNFNVDFLQ